MLRMQLVILLPRSILIFWVQSSFIQDLSWYLSYSSYEIALKARGNKTICSMQFICIMPKSALPLKKLVNIFREHAKCYPYKLFFADLMIMNGVWLGKYMQMKYAPGTEFIDLFYTHLAPKSPLITRLNASGFPSICPTDRALTNQSML